MNLQVLVLNADYRVIGICHWQKAVTLMFSNKIEVLESYDKPLRSANMEMKMPAVIRLIDYVKPKKVTLRFNKLNVYLRDKGECAYCLKKLTLSESTYDHVLPKSRGGKTDFKGVVLSCKACNLKKDCKTPEEARMTLHKKPFIPSQVTTETSFYMSTARSIRPEWQKWLFNSKESII